jgi:hypothetical protein
MNRFFKAFPILIFISFLLISCAQNDSGQPVSEDTLTEAQRHLPENALKGLTLAKGLEVTPFVEKSYQYGR